MHHLPSRPICNQRGPTTHLTSMSGNTNDTDVHSSVAVFATMLCYYEDHAEDNSCGVRQTDNGVSPVTRLSHCFDKIILLCDNSLDKQPPQQPVSLATALHCSNCCSQNCLPLQPVFLATTFFSNRLT